MYWEKANVDIRTACNDNNIPLWMLAEKLKCADTTLSKKLRRELPPKKKREILDIIEQLGKEVKKEDES